MDKEQWDMLLWLKGHLEYIRSSLPESIAKADIAHAIAMADRILEETRPKE